MPRLTTGDAGLDQVLGGGIPAGSAVVLSGPPGAGKSILAEQIAFANATQDAPALLVSTLTESQPKLLRHISQLGFFDEERFGTAVVPLSGVDRLRTDGVEGLVRLVVTETVRRRPSLVVVDSAKAMTEWGRASGTSLRSALYDLVAQVDHTGATLLLVGEYAHEDLQTRPEFAVADAILELDNVVQGAEDRRSLRVAKLRGSDYLPGRHSLLITGDGVQAHPRLESIIDTPKVVGAKEGRATTGVDGLDDLLGGGLSVGDSTLVLGPSGVGKTVFALHAVAACVRDGERALYVTLEEPPDALRTKWRSFGLPLDEADETGRLALQHAPIAGLDIDRLGHQVRRHVEEHRPSRVVIDSLGEIVTQARRDGRYPGYVWALASAAQAAGALVMFTQEVEVLGASDRDSDVSHLFHNVLMLRYIERDGMVGRAFSVMKMRDSAHDMALHHLRITADGMRVIGEAEDASGLLGWSTTTTS